jgi:hypothetical protein
MKEGKRAARHSAPTPSIRRGCYARGNWQYGNSISTVKSGPQKRAGRNTGTCRGGSSEETKKKRAAARAVAVTGRERQRRRRLRERPLQEMGGGIGGGRYLYRKWAAAVT